MKSIPSQKTALLLTGIILLLCIISCAAIFLRQTSDENHYTAYIYVNGDLYQTIPLHQVTAAYDFTIRADDGGYNTIHVEQDAIRIQAADCPDQVCVKQGAIHNSLLPITCLPHSLVIELKPSETTGNTYAPDAITH